LVLDTNVWISALLWAGPPNEILRIGESKRIVLVASPSIVDGSCVVAATLPPFR
jgi:predicted nucleic acid-binding protein